MSVLFLTAFLVRLYFASTLSLNPDECLHVNAASSAQYAVYHHPPLILWWIGAVTLVSHQEWWLRLLPLLAGAALPIVTGLWLRQSLSGPTSWALAVLVAFAPNLVLLSIQIRGYSLALLGLAVALYALERAFAEASRRWLFLHFAALLVAILAEFMTAWVALAMGLYGLLRLYREPQRRPLALGWSLGQSFCLGVYVILYITVVRPIAEHHTPPNLVEQYLRGAFPQPGQSLLWFTLVGSVKQVAYWASSAEGGVVAVLLLSLGFGRWLLCRQSHAVLIGAIPLAALGAIFQFYPYGRSRHTVALGLVFLLAIGAGVDVLAGLSSRLRLRLAALVALGFICYFRYAPDQNNQPLPVWNKARWERSMEALQRAVPAGSTVLTDGETFQTLQTTWAPRHDRARIHNQFHSAVFRSLRWEAHKAWDWRHIPATWIANQTDIWLLDTGYTVEWAKPLARAAGAETIIDEPGVLYLARLRR